jgi:4-hydroxybenzoate polyprenyltransferase
MTNYTFSAFLVVGMIIGVGFYVYNIILDLFKDNIDKKKKRNLVFVRVSK